MVKSWLLVLLVSLPAAAQTATGPGLGDLVQARNFGMGNAYNALGYGAEVVGGNPAALSLYKRYQIEAGGAWDVPNGYGFGTLQLADSSSSSLAMGLSYHFATYGAADRRWAHITTVALALPLAEFLHLGVSARHHVITGATNTNSITMSAGLVVRPVSFLTIGLSGHNLIPNYNPDVTRHFVVSAAGQFLGQLSPTFDLKMDLNGSQARFAYQGGLEWLAGMSFPLRLGYTWDGIDDHQYIGGGLGYFSEGSGIDLSYRHELGGDRGQLIALTIKVQL